jgi:hypothetical protein
MPPSEYGSSADFESAVDTGPYVPRFTRDQLDKTGQKIYDQLKQQRTQLQKGMGEEQAGRLYTDFMGLQPDETLALMAQQLQSTGITDIYKVKKQNVKTPLQYVPGDEYSGGDSFVDSSGARVYGDIKQDDKGNYYTEGEKVVNTETGKPITPSVGQQALAANPNILSDYRLQSRRFVGTGVEFTPEGVPVYFSTGYKRPTEFQESGLSPVLALALTAALGPAGLQLSMPAAGAIAGGVTGLAQSGGDINAALKSALLGGATSYGLEQLLGASAAGMNVPSPADFAAMEATGLEALTGPSFNVPSPADFAAMEALGNFGYTPGEIDEILKTSLSQAASGIPGDLQGLSDKDLLDLTMSESGAVTTPDVSKPDWDTSYPQDNLVDTGTLKSPPMTPDQVAAAAALRGIGDPAMAAELGTADLSWMDKVNPAQLAAIDTGTLPGTTLGDKLAYTLGAAASKVGEKLATPAGLAAAGFGLASLAEATGAGKGGGGAGGGGGGWSGSMPRYTLERSTIPFTREPYSKEPVMGRAFFTEPKYVPRQEVAAAQGGIMNLNSGRYLRGKTDGMADKIPSNIDGVQPAALSHGEFVIPADVVSHLGNGNSEAGADVLYKMMDRVRKARTGSVKQGKEINPGKYVPGGIVTLADGGSVGTTQVGTGITGPITTSSSSTLSPWIAPSITETLGRAESFAFEPYKPYTGQLTATESPVQGKAFQAAKGLSDPSRKFSTEMAQTYMNPYLSMVQQPLMSELDRQAAIRQQDIQSQFTRAGAFGGAREAVARAENERNLQAAKAKMLGETTAAAYDQAAKMYGFERSQDIADLNAMLRAGESQRAIESEGIGALKSEYEKQQAAPMERLSQYIAMMRGLPISTSTSTPIMSDLQRLGLTVEQSAKLYNLLSGLGA